MRRRTVSFRLVLVVAIFCAASRGSMAGPVLVGPEIRVDASTAGVAFAPSVASRADGSFVVVWQAVYRNASGVRGQCFDGAGRRVGTEFVVSEPRRRSGPPGIGMDRDGDFLVVWPAKVRSGHHVFGRRYDDCGRPAGSSFQVTTSPRIEPGGNVAVAMAADGHSVVVWDGRFDYIRGQLFDPTGERVGPDFTVDQGSSAPAVAIGDAGRFVVASQFNWYGEGYTDNVYAQIFDGDADALTGALPVNSHRPGNQNRPAAAMARDGRFVVVWQSDGHPDGGGVFAQRFTATGAREGGELPAGPVLLGSHSEPAVAMGPGGDFLVVWTSGGIVGQMFDSAGAADGGSFRVSSIRTRFPSRPAVSLTENGQAVVVWQRTDRRSAGGIYAQRFADDAPEAPADPGAGGSPWDYATSP